MSWAARLAAAPVYFYRLVLSPLLPRNCRFEPSCSVYALEALARHGLFKGSWLTLRRLSRCHPFKWLGAGEGYDPVPGTPEAERLEAERRKASHKKDICDGG
ncbi:MAG: membrane protein insertion efficiency factor YidD [Neomegalonema sp.]|nr:membrane protein insertion efficiency factor YidD [Neomegalonema sp.]